MCLQSRVLVLRVWCGGMRQPPLVDVRLRLALCRSRLPQLELSKTPVAVPSTNGLSQTPDHHRSSQTQRWTIWYTRLAPGCLYILGRALSGTGSRAPCTDGTGQLRLQAGGDRAVGGESGMAVARAPGHTSHPRTARTLARAVPALRCRCRVEHHHASSTALQRNQPILHWKHYFPSRAGLPPPDDDDYRAAASLRCLLGEQGVCVGPRLRTAARSAAPCDTAGDTRHAFMRRHGRRSTCHPLALSRALTRPRHTRRRP